VLINSLADNLDLQNLYLLFGAEELLISQSKDKILKNLKNSGFENKYIFDIDAKFNFTELNNELVAGDLFSTKKIIQLNITSFGVKITKELTEIVENIKQGVVVLIIAGKLTPAQQKTKWFSSINSQGLVINHKEIYPNQMQNFVILQMEKIGLIKNLEVAKIIAENNEGNLLNAFNEIQKLKFMFGSGEIDTNKFIEQSRQQSIYSPYALIDSAMLGNTNNVIKIYKVLKMDSNYLCSLLYGNVKQLIDIHLKIKQKVSLDNALSEVGVWSSKKSLFNSALKRHSYPVLQKILLKIGRVERSNKGMDNKNPNQELLTILLELSGVKVGI
jgi:DNA polymerase-3 subunit delta